MALLAGRLAHADPLEFDIPEQDAASAIVIFAAQSGYQIFAPTDQLRSVRTNPVHGVMEPEEALEGLLRGTGIEAVPAGLDTLIIRQTRPASGPPETEAAPPIRAPAPVLPPPPPQPERILVTGSRLLREENAVVQATYRLEAEQLASQGVFNVAEGLEDLPGFGISSASAVGVQSTFGVGQRFVNFFGLGSQRTLTLVNGRRFVSSATASSVGAPGSGHHVDFNLIPLGMIDRIETVAIGGAPAYGADAVAGTVNIILKDRFEGAVVEARYGLTERGDTPRRAVRGIFGQSFGAGRGELVVSAEYDSNGGLLERDRPLFAQRPFLTTQRGADGELRTVLRENMVLAGITDGGIPLPLDDLPAGWRNEDWPDRFFIFDADGSPVQFLPDGTLGPYRLGAGGGDEPVFVSGGDGLRIPDYMTLVAPGERTLASLIARYDLSAGVTAFVEYSAARSEGEEPRELLAINSALLPEQGGPLIMSVDNPFLRPEARAVIEANGLTEFALSRNLSDIIDHRPGRTEILLHRIVTGLEGEFDWDGRAYRWDAAINLGRSENLSRIPTIEEANFRAAIDATVDPASGRIVCAPPAPAGCRPLNLFGAGAADRAAIDFVTAMGTALSVNEQQALSLSLAGEAGFLAAGPLGFSLGAEYRREYAAFRPDERLAAGSARLPAFAAVEGEFSTRELFGEFLAPVVADSAGRPLIAEAAIEGAIRHMDNSIAGADIAWTLGGRLRPRFGADAAPFALRGVMTRSVRAPTITELFLPESPTRGTATDPCDRRNVDAGPAPDVRAANCAAALADAGAGPPSDFTSDIISFGVTGRLTGNPELRNEEAQSWSIGIAFEDPRHEQQVSLDWISISLTEGIASLTASQLLAACYDSPDYPAAPACRSVVRGRGANAGQIVDYEVGYFNTARIDFDTLMFAAERAFQPPAWLGGDRIEAAVRLAYIDRVSIRQFETAAPVDASGTLGWPRLKATMALRYFRGASDAALRIHWTGSGRYDSTAPDDFPANRITAHTLVSASAGTDLRPGLRLQINIDNLFDTPPPEATLVSASPTSRRAYDVLGRRFTLGLRATF